MIIIFPDKILKVLYVHIVKICNLRGNVQERRESWLDYGLGNHGFLPTDVSMWGAFLATGPGKSSVFHNISITITI